MTVDHDERRREIARVAIDLVASEGLAAATIRRIAAEAGASTTLITQCFDDKYELLVYTFDLLSRDGERRFEDVLEADPGDTMGALLTMVPWCPANVRRWKAYLAFWDGAARNPDLARLMRHSTQGGMALLRRLLEMRSRPDADFARAAEMLAALVQGLALQMLVDVPNWPIEKIRTALAESFDLALSRAV